MQLNHAYYQLTYITANYAPNYYYYIMRMHAHPYCACVAEVQTCQLTDCVLVR